MEDVMEKSFDLNTDVFITESNQEIDWDEFGRINRLDYLMETIHQEFLDED